MPFDARRIGEVEWVTTDGGGTTQLCNDEPCTCGAAIHSADVQMEIARLFLRARERRRARLATEDPEALARELAREVE